MPFAVQLACKTNRLQRWPDDLAVASLGLLLRKVCLSVCLAEELFALQRVSICVSLCSNSSTKATRRRTKIGVKVGVKKQCKIASGGPLGHPKSTRNCSQNRFGATETLKGLPGMIRSVEINCSGALPDAPGHSKNVPVTPGASRERPESPQKCPHEKRELFRSAPGRLEARQGN